LNIKILSLIDELIRKEHTR